MKAPRFMRIAVIALIIAMGLFNWHLNSANRRVEKLQTTSAVTAFRDTVATQCAEAAYKVFYDKTSGDGSSSRYKDHFNHFNSKLKQCFVLISTYSFNDDVMQINLYDAVKWTHYAEYTGHNICDVEVTKDPKKCAHDSGQIWFDGNDSRTADFTVGFRGVLYGTGAGDESTQTTFRDHIQSFMTE
jgi:hypothetical protein